MNKSFVPYTYTYPLYFGSRLRFPLELKEWYIFGMNSEDNLAKIRHSLAHLLAAAVLQLYPEAKNTIGPAVDNGFYYDFDLGETKLTDKDLSKIEQKMREILKKWEVFQEISVSAQEAKTFFSGNKYKLELIGELEAKNEPITIYYSGPKKDIPSKSEILHTEYQILYTRFIDLCRGGHADNPAKEIASGSWKLSHIAGAYWRGSEKNAMLTRIYGLAFESKEALIEYEKKIEEAKKHDHRKLGQELKIFTFDEEIGPGLPLWLPNGGAMIEELEKLARETEFRAGYVRVRTPHITKSGLYEKSGHLPYYEETMYPPMEYEGGKYYLKPMNCPHHHKIFVAEPRSYRDLPLRLAEYGTVYRHEKSGELFGLMRVRMMQMNDAHIYCTEEQFADEFRKVNEMYIKYFKIFGIEKYIMRFSTHDPKRLGEKFVNEPELWKKTEEMVRKVLVESKIPFVEVSNEAAFYGPKIDVQVWSIIGREFTLATNQVDFAVPRRFGLSYTSAAGKPETPLVIHRAPLGTHERFIGFLIEHYAGVFPLWLSPVQVKILPVGEAHVEEARKISAMLRECEIRAEMDDTDESLGKKVRKAKLMKVPYYIIVGDKDLAEKKATLESRDRGQIGQMTAGEIRDILLNEIKSRVDLKHEI